MIAGDNMAAIKVAVPESLATLEAARVRSDGVATRSYREQLECEQSCGMFFFPLDELPADQQAQLQHAGFVNADLDVRASLSVASLAPTLHATDSAQPCVCVWRQPMLMREKHVDFLRRGLLRLSSGFVSLDARCARTKVQRW